MSLKDKLNGSLGSFLQKSINKEKKEASDLSFIWDLGENIVTPEEEVKEPLKEQLKRTEAYSANVIDKFVYYATNFWKKLYILEHDDYKTWKKTIWKVRWGNKQEAWESAMKLYNLSYSPNKIREIEVWGDRLLDRVVTNPTFFLNKKIDKLELWEFLVEYASLLEDGLWKKQGIDILLKTIKDKTLKDFLYELRDSSYKMSQLMKRAGSFDEYTISIIESSEASWGDTAFYTGISKLGVSYIEEETFRRNFIKGLYYPAFLITLVIALLFWVLKGLVPMLAGIFSEITNGKLPGSITSLLYLWENLYTYIAYIVGGLAAFYIIKKVLFTNPIMMIRYELLKLRLPLIGPIIRLVEENRVFSILVQTLESQMTPLQKIQSFQKASKSSLYNKVYQYMYKNFPRKQNLLSTFNEVNKKFNAEIFWERFLITLEVGGVETKKRHKKYKQFLEKNQERLRLRLKKIQTLIFAMTTVFIAMSLAVVMGMVFSIVLNAISGM